MVIDSKVGNLAHSWAVITKAHGSRWCHNPLKYQGSTNPWYQIEIPKVWIVGNKSLNDRYGTMLLNKQTGADAQLSLSRPLGHCSSSSSSYHTGDNIPTLCRQLEFHFLMPRSIKSVSSLMRSRASYNSIFRMESASLGFLGVKNLLFFHIVNSVWMFSKKSHLMLYLTMQKYAGKKRVNPLENLGTRGV